MPWGKHCILVETYPHTICALGMLLVDPPTPTQACHDAYVTQQSPRPDGRAQGLLTRTVHVFQPSTVTLAAASTLAVALLPHRDYCSPCHLRHSSHVCQQSLLLVGTASLMRRSEFWPLGDEQPSLCHAASEHHGFGCCTVHPSAPPILLLCKQLAATFLP